MTDANVQDTNQLNYHTAIVANVTPQEAFDKISRVSGWWGTNVEGESQHLNDSFTIHFGDVFVKFKVVELVPNKKAVWRVVDCHLSWLNDKTEWNDTQLVWEITSDNNATRVDMTHLGLVPGIECYEGCKIGWDNNIHKSLLKLLTDNQGLPDTF